MSPIRLRTALPLLLLVGVAAPVQADVGVSVECSDCSILPEDVVILVMNDSLAQAMADDSECESAAHAAARQVAVDVAVTGVPECLDDVPLYSFQFNGWQIVTTEGWLAAMTTKSDSAGSGDEGCGGFFLSNFLQQIEDPAGAFSNSFSFSVSCMIEELVGAVIR